MKDTVLSIRDMPAGFMKKLRILAAEEGVTLRDYCLARLDPPVVYDQTFRVSQTLTGGGSVEMRVVKPPTFKELKAAIPKVQPDQAIVGLLGPLPESVAKGFKKDAKAIAAKVPKTTVASSLHSGHDPKTCRVYKCGLCAALSQNEK